MCEINGANRWPQICIFEALEMLLAIGEEDSLSHSLPVYPFPLCVSTKENFCFSVRESVRVKGGSIAVIAQKKNERAIRSDKTWNTKYSTMHSQNQKFSTRENPMASVPKYKSFGEYHLGQKCDIFGQEVKNCNFLERRPESRKILLSFGIK